MEPIIPHAAQARPLGNLTRLLAMVAGVNALRLAQCPPDDRLAVQRTGLALLCSFAFTTLVLTGAMGVALEWSNAVLAPIAALMAGMVILIDHAIIQSHWFQSGLDAARARGFDSDGPRLPGTISRFAVGVVRLALSLAIAFTLAGFVDLLIYQRDIQHQIADDNRAANAAVIVRARAVADGEIARVDGEAARLATEAGVILGRASAADEAAGGARLAVVRQLTARLDVLQSERARQEEDNLASRRDAIFEKNGVKESAKHSGVAGQGKKFAAAMETGLLAADRIEAINADIASIEQRLSAEQVVRPSASDSSAVTLANLSRDRAALVERGNGLVAGREARIDKLMRADPDHVALEDGLVLRLGAMMKLMQEPAVWIKVWGLKAVIMIIEMGGLLTKVMLVTPSLYAVRTATDFEADAAAVMAKAVDGLAQSYGAMAEAQDKLAALRERQHRDSRRRRTAAKARDWFSRELGDGLGGPRQTH